MKVSMKGKYALKLMIDLAEQGSERPITLKDIASRQKISEKYLEQVVSMLNRAGLVKSIRGAQGGYRLIRKPYDYKVGEILRITEGSMDFYGETEEDDISRILWDKINEAISDVVDNITLEDVLMWKQEMAYNYSI